MGKLCSPDRLTTIVSICKQCEQCKTTKKKIRVGSVGEFNCSFRSLKCIRRASRKSGRCVNWCTSICVVFSAVLILGLINT